MISLLINLESLLGFVPIGLVTMATSTTTMRWSSQLGIANMARAAIFDGFLHFLTSSLLTTNGRSLRLVLAICDI